MTLAFDTLTCSKRFQAVGISAEQAEVHAEVLRDIIDNDLATKRDIKELEVKLDAKIETTKIELKHDLTLRLGGMLVVGIGLVATLVKIL